MIATGEMHSVREFVEKAFRHVGKEIEWEGEAEKVRLSYRFSKFNFVTSQEFTISHNSVKLERRSSGRVKLKSTTVIPFFIQVIFVTGFDFLGG